MEEGRFTDSGGHTVTEKCILRMGDGRIYRVLKIQEDRALVVSCREQRLPVWKDCSALSEGQTVPETVLPEADPEGRGRVETDSIRSSLESLSPERRAAAYERYTVIAGILPYAGDKAIRSMMISRAASEHQLSLNTVRHYLWRYLVFQDIAALAPGRQKRERELTEDEKTMRWALNRFFYTKNRITLTAAYTLMLKARYCDEYGKLRKDHPSISQFRYFYHKTRKMQTYYISRDGLTSYQRDRRPLLGDGIQDYAPSVGVSMLDATVCDIYLVNEAGGIVGRPVLVTDIDAFSSLCCSYCLLWEGGVYSLRELLRNRIRDKAELCREKGVEIRPSDWDCSGSLQGVFVTDMGREYQGGTFAQIAELGCRIVNLPAYRPELKGSVEQLFDIIQENYKPYLKGKGVIEPDFQQRGVRDYRKDACLTMEAFEKIVLRCILYYNRQRILEHFPYTEEMLKAGVRPVAEEIWEWGKKQDGANLILATEEQVRRALLPRCAGRFTRRGLMVNGMRYRCAGDTDSGSGAGNADRNYTEDYLCGRTVEAAYSPDDVSAVWIVGKGTYTPFRLIENRYAGKTLEEVREMADRKKSLIRKEREPNLQARVDLAGYIEDICAASEIRVPHTEKDLRDIRSRRETERERERLKSRETAGRIQPEE